MLSALLNGALGPEQHAKLQPFAGKAFRLTLAERREPWCFRYDGKRFVAAPAATPVAVTLEGNLAGLGAFIRREPPPPGGKLSFSGELYDAQLLQEALRGVEPNWEAWLQQQFGATPGRLLYDGGQKIKAGADFLAQQLFVGRDEYAPLVQRLRRLQQRLDALARELDDVAGV